MGLKGLTAAEPDIARAIRAHESFSLFRKCYLSANGANEQLDRASYEERQQEWTQQSGTIKQTDRKNQSNISD